MKNFNEKIMGNFHVSHALKLLMVMKLTLVLILVSTLSIYANLSYAQTKKLTLKMEDVKVEDVLSNIEKQSEFYFFVYSEKVIDVERKVSVDLEGQNIEKVLKTVFAGTDVTYSIRDRLIVLSTPNVFENTSRTAWQQVTVSGKVTDNSNQPLPGVTVIIKGTTQGTVTNADGEYTITNIPENAILQFSFVGMRAQEITVGNQKTIDVKMEEETIGLGEVVAIGYGTMKKSDLTGSVVRVEMEQKENQANVNLLQSLAGTSAGVNIEGRGGAGSEPAFSVRGQTSLSASNRPLIVIDGIIYNGSIADININDVESIDILKDASAASVYGSRSANGVMIITTKKGTSESPVVSFNMYYGFQDMTNNPMRVMNADEFAVRLVDWSHQNLVYQWYTTNPTSAAGRPVRPDVTNRELVATYLKTQEEKDNYLAGNEIDWVDEVLQIAPMQNYNLSLSGKSGEKVNYFVSGSYTDVEGIQLNDKYERFTLRSNLVSEVNDWLSLSINTSYSYMDNSRDNNSSINIDNVASLGNARVASPLVNNFIGEPSYDIYLGGELFQPYPLVYTYIDNSITRNQLHLIGNAKIKIPWIEGLTNEVNYSNMYTQVDNNAYHNYNTPSGVSNRGLAEKHPSRSRDWILNNIVTYARTFGDHQLNSTLLFSREGRTGDASSLNAEGFDNQALGYNNMGLGEVSTVSSSAWEENSLSYMARLNYSYKSRYMVTGTIRKDGFSGFGAEKKWATFPSLSLAWVFSDESFFSDMNFYSKLRVSYGKNGNQGIGRYSSLSRMGTRYYVFGQATAIGLYPSTLGNADLGWETTESYNLGVDFGFLNNKITGSVDVYTAETKDVLVERQLPRAAGYSSVWANIGGLNNKGIELEVRSVNVDNGNFKWESSFIFSLNRDKITKLYGENDDADIGNQWFVGEPISAIYDYKMAGGVWTEEEFFAGKIPLKGWYPGQFRYVDQNRDSLITPDYDRTIIGYAAPSYRFSINNTLSYKNFGLTFLINSIQGGDKYYLADNATNVSPRFYMQHRMNNSAINPYWRPDAPTTNTTGIYNNPPQESGIYQSRSFVRLQDITLSYNLGQNLLDALKLQKCQFYISSKNPYVWTKWQGWDPETGASDTPLMRNIIAGIRLSL
ncbi:SusC/RagA family TonB-linked outer membrane protein [Mariniphaga sediminis]|uniref:SusC/RagA family TonB-linked outer membrane protein n=2 Tax=Mariniphaga sediminis TaxID=1628158 RepID=A0A399CZE2_9BACT|nr:SusC/RagA family TonB-linked outer membrane protein [Mariniphaga sediminis]RIH66577.1 SusC/RagA family TonB-linked outer membrane protein [Mariniphaga sediminis]